MKLTVKAEIRFNHARAKIRTVKSAAADATWEAGGIILAEAQRRVRRGKNPKPDEVTVHDSLQIVGKHGDDVIMVGSVGAHRSRPVARWLEGGTHRQHAHPFLKPGAALGRKHLKEQAAAKVQQELST